MKKNMLNLLLIIIVLFSSSCKNEEKTEVVDDPEKIEEIVQKKEDKTSNVSTTTETSVDIPSFNDQKVQAYVNSYEAYIEKYKKIVESKDMTAFASLGQKGQELSTKAQEIMGNLSADDVKKLNDYMLAKSTELQELSKKLMQ
ncbi:hypothetical protein [Aquimarina sp. RZ0]|uniref:hypothetical protein n=1 Tax=Aquimarina sp. RZ0 TaxID=2607730 RepID=UPI0011F32CC7|nr:hypothetical protein [Aquimarina sp. RZ0]KAA1246916.1 hypothetical protein F0000_05505 [Aquimarina sp. RZ0]